LRTIPVTPTANLAFSHHMIRLRTRSFGRRVQIQASKRTAGCAARGPAGRASPFTAPL
jgi:hypothetical protein